jgi:exosortase/archaeosortase family protein
MTFQRCGLVSTTIFGLLLLLLLYPLRASLLRKIVWLEIGLLIGLAWGFLRLLVSVLVSYYFGAGALAVTDFLTGPFTDIFWAVAVWSLALSTLVPKKQGD